MSASTTAVQSKARRALLAAGHVAPADMARRWEPLSDDDRRAVLDWADTGLLEAVAAIEADDPDLRG